MKKWILLCAVIATAGLSSAFAQGVSGTIEGTILDASNAPVPKAKVTVTNTDRNQVVRTITTDTTGSYNATLIPVGTYAVKVEAAGFKAENRTGIVLNVDDDLKINISLQVGAVTESVDVKADAATVDLASATGATTITGEQVRELSLGTRNYEQLVALVPGVAAGPTDDLYIGNSSPSGLSAALPYSVNGNRTSANNWTVDGADNVDRGANLTLMTFPSVDAIAEFKVERSLYGADTGRAGGGQISVVTRGGQSKFHGSAYEFFRNDALAANNWANNANSVNLVNGAAKIPPIRWNDFGYTIGGPVVFPHYNKDRNKTFFFFSEEFRRIITYATFNPTLPTQAMLSGTFFQPVCIAATNGTCPAGAGTVTQIPANLINPNSAAYIKDIFSKIALPTGTTTATFASGFFAQRNLFNSRQEIGRIDHSFSEKFQIWGRFGIDTIPTTEAGGLFTGSTIPNGAITNTNSPGRSIAVHAINSIRDGMLNDLAFNFSQSAIHATPEGITTKANAPDVNPKEPFANTQGVVPNLSFTGGTSIVGYGPYNELNRNYALTEGLTMLRGRHSLKFGVIVNRYNKTENAANQQGTFTFSSGGLPTGTTSFNQAWANFLLGNVATFTMPSTDITPNLWQWQTEAYAQDNFKLSPRLTVYAGLRYSFFGQVSADNNMLTNFDPVLYSKANAPQIDPTNGNVIPNTGNNPTTNGIIIGGKNSPFGDHVSDQRKANFAPRVGLAWDPFGTGTTSIRTGYGVYFDSVEVGTYETNSFTNPPYVSSVNYSNASFTDVTAGTLGVSAAPLVLRATQIPAHIPYVQHWSVDVQRQLGKGSMLDVGYYGSKGTHLQGIVDINQAYPGVALAAGLHTTTGTGASGPGTTIFTTADDPRINAVRPYLGFNAINAIETAFDSNYHSLQVAFRKALPAGGTVNVAYTFSKTLTDNTSDSGAAPQNSYNWHEGEYGPYSGDRGHIFSLSYVYHLPMLRSAPHVVQAIAGGWETSGIVSAYTGAPFTVTTSSVDPAGLGLLGSSAASSRPDMTCNPNANAPHTFGGNSNRTGTSWYNTACFTPVVQGAVRPGNAGRGVVRGPGYGNWDETLMKNFALAAEGRVNLQLRGEAFNILNLVEPNGFSSNNITSTTFGVISSWRAARRVQIAAKITF